MIFPVLLLAEQYEVPLVTSKPGLLCSFLFYIHNFIFTQIHKKIFNFKYHLTLNL